MKITRLVATAAIAMIAFSSLANAQKTKQTVTPVEITAPAVDHLNEAVVGPLSPGIGAGYKIETGFIVENPIDGTSLGGAGGLIGLDTTGDGNPDTVVDGVMDGVGDVVGTDLGDIFGVAGDASDVNADEILCNLGLDPLGSGRFLLELTVFVEATGTDLLWDSLITDTTGDGFFDTGDGVLNQPFPLDPLGLVFLIDNDGDGDPNNDPPSPATTVALFIGANSGGGTNIFFDPAAGEVDVQTANWELRNFDGDLADLDLDGIEDGPFDVVGFAVFNPPLGGGWAGDFGVGFGVDGDITTTDEVVGGSVKTNALVVTYLSDIDAAEFGKDDGPGCGDVNLDGVLDLLDVAPFVDLIVTGVFQAEGDINGDGVVDLADVAPFVDKLING